MAERVKSHSEEIGVQAGAQRALEDMAWGPKADTNRRIMDVEAAGAKSPGTKATIKLLRKKGFGQWGQRG